MAGPWGARGKGVRSAVASATSPGVGGVAGRGSYGGWPPTAPISPHDESGAALISRYQALVRHSSDVISIVDASGVIEYQSPSIERVLGYQPDTLVGESVFDYINPDDRAPVQAAIAEAVEAPEGTVSEAEYRFEHADGSWVWLSSVATDRPGAAEGFVVNSRDVTARKRYEAELETRNDELEALNRVVRHDIRNDMTVILGWAELLEDHIDEEGQELLARVLSSGQHVIELTEIARDFVDTLTSEAEPDLRPVSLRSALETELALGREFYPDATFTVEGDLPDVDVRATEMLSSVFTNLLRNAVQHNRAPEPTVTVSAEMEEGLAVVRIADDGPGVPQAAKDRIFGKGEKGLESEGTGIGLYLVRTLVEQFGGDVRVEDNEPEGAVFVVELQLAN